MSFSMIISSSQFARSGWTYCPQSSGWLREAVDSELEFFIFTVPVGDILRTCFFGHWKTFYVYVQSAWRRFQIRALFIAPFLSTNPSANKKTVFENSPEWVPLVLKCPIFANATHCVEFRLKKFHWSANQNWLRWNYFEILPQGNHPHMKIFQGLNLSF